MDFKELTYVVALARYQNYTDAAKSLFITQPALTKSIKKLELELDEPLFIRNKNSTIPTDFGLKYVQYAQSILSLKNTMDRELQMLHDRKYPVLRVGITPVSGRFLLSQTAIAYQKKHPNVQLSFTEGITLTLYDMVEKGDLDLAICVSPGSPPFPARPNLQTAFVQDTEIVLAVPPDHPLISMATIKPEFQYPWIPLEWARNEKFLLQPEDQFTTMAARHLFKQLNFQPASINNLTNVHSAIDLVCAGCGVAIVTNMHLAILEQKVKLTALSIGTHPLYNKTVAIYRKGTSLPPYAVDYVDLVREVYRAILLNL
ncbi:hypothetical protein C0033_19880 [Clostridium sp. chh4-2]|uniref:LysR family transcriptional regulator n=1 Tax=Clostridium sp. chh4-2 TaxID=2067550 RepID=UPI000CCE6305|nr:LysR family transcriptional regulator [Clostridium sp. chh4-2]PNV60303.1 hypothetical protein C0033_19880 [Clostridium sp. chh4-2]